MVKATLFKCHPCFKCKKSSDKFTCYIEKDSYPTIRKIQRLHVQFNNINTVYKYIIYKSELIEKPYNNMF